MEGRPFEFTYENRLFLGAIQIIRDTLEEGVTVSLNTMS
jgi:hypothetical protein